MAGEWMSLTYTDNGASETRAYRSVHMETEGSAQFQRLGNLSHTGYGPPPAGVPFEWQSFTPFSLDCSSSTSCLAPAAGHNCTGAYPGQCTWADEATARASCGAWDICAGFYCSSTEVKGERVCFARVETAPTPPHDAADAAWLKTWNRTDMNPQWRMVESGDVRTVFATDPVETLHSRVWLEATAWAALPHLGLTVHIDNWTSAFGVANRIVLPMAGAGACGDRLGLG